MIFNKYAGDILAGEILHSIEVKFFSDVASHVYNSFVVVQMIFLEMVF